MKWFKENWKIIVFSGLGSSIIYSIYALVLGWIKSLFNNETLWKNVINVIATRISIPLWIIILLLAGFIIIIYVLRIKRKRNYYGEEIKTLTTKKGKVNLDKVISSDQIIGSAEIHQTGLGVNSSINSKILDCKTGIFSIWAYVSDIHNIVYPQRKFKYIIAHATNSGNPLGNSNLARYPNAWAIQRLTPIPDDKNGIWRFWCNNIDKNLVHLDYNEPLSGGWHLFSVSWSEKENYIKFIIDEKVVAENNYRNWPSDFSGSIMIGTWPTKHRDHYFDSKVGMWKFVESGYNEKLIKTFYEIRPK
jgi:hypothetical protein